MKKRKVFLPMLMSLAMVSAVSFAGACSVNDEDTDKDKDPSTTPTDTLALQDISISGSYTTEYQLNDTFSSDGLIVSASLMDIETSQYTTEVVTSDAVVDYSSFNSSVVGTYTITISYTRTDVTRYASYTVSVAAYDPVINGIAIEKETVEYDIPQGQSAVEINVDDITVKAIDANGEEEETPLASDAYDLAYYNGGEKLDDLTEVGKGSYTIEATRKTDGQKAFVVVYVFDPAVSIEFKEGTVTQAQALTDNMSEDWSFTVTDRSGTTHELTVDQVTLADINSLVPGSYTVEVSYNEYDGKGNLASEEDLTTTVGYTITKVNDMVNQSYAVNFSNMSAMTVTKDNVNADGEYVVNEDAGVSLIPGSNTITIESNSAKSGTKSFSQRLKFGGTSNATGRQIKVELKGASLITVYAKTGSSSSARGLGLFKSMAITSSGNRLDNTEKMLGSDIYVLTYLVDNAGTYYLAAPDGDLNLYYIQIDTVLMGEAAEGQESIELPTETELNGITINTDDVKKAYIVGEELKQEDYANLIINKNIYNPVTAELKTEVATDDNYTVAVTAGSLDEVGEATITVTYGGKTATYKVSVNSLVEGVNGIKASTSKPSIELESATETVEISKDDIAVKTDGDEDITIGTEAGDCTGIAYDLYRVDGTNEEKLESWTVGEGTYKVVVTATYKNSTIAGTTDFTAEFTVTVKVKAVEGGTTTESFVVPKLESESEFTETTYSSGSNIADNSLFTLGATVAMKTSFGGAYGNLQKSGNEVSYTAMDGSTVNPNQGIKLSSAIKSNVTVDSILTVTAKSDMTLYLYVTWANDGYSSNKTGDIFYSVDGGEKTTQSISSRKTVWVISVELKKDQVLTLGATNTHADDGKLWLFGAEAKTNATETVKQSFVVPKLESESEFTETTYSSGGNIADNSLFALGATVAMKTSFGGAYDNLQKSGNEVSYTAMDGSTVNPNQGIKLSSAIKSNVTVDSILTVTAKSDMTLYLYVTWANDGYSSNKTGDIFYSVDGGEKTTQSISSRKTVWVISVELKKDQVLTLGATNTHADDGKLWLFGAEAISK